MSIPNITDDDLKRILNEVRPEARQPLLPVAEIDDVEVAWRSLPELAATLRLGFKLGSLWLCCSIQRKIKNVVVAQPATGCDRPIGCVQRTREHERDRLL